MSGRRARGRDRQHLPGRRRLRRRGRSAAPAARHRATTCGSRTSASVACTSPTSCSTATTRSCSSTRCRWGSVPAPSSVVEVDPVEPTTADDAGVLEAHSLDPVVVLDLVAHLGGAVERVVVVGCEPESLDDGIGLSPPVACAVDGAIDADRRPARRAVRTACRYGREGDLPMIRKLVVLVALAAVVGARDPLAARPRAVPEDPRDVSGSWVGTASCPNARRCSSPRARASTRSTRAPTGSRGSSRSRCRAGAAVNVTVPAKGRVSLPVERMSSGNPLEDRELRRRIDARRYPTIDGELTGMSETGHGRSVPGAGRGHLQGRHPELRGGDAGVAGR